MAIYCIPTLIFGENAMFTPINTPGGPQLYIRNTSSDTERARVQMTAVRLREIIRDSRVQSHHRDPDPLYCTKSLTDSVKKTLLNGKIGAQSFNEASRTINISERACLLAAVFIAVQDTDVREACQRTNSLGDFFSHSSTSLLLPALFEALQSVPEGEEKFKRIVSVLDNRTQAAVAWTVCSAATRAEKHEKSAFLLPTG